MIKIELCIEFTDGKKETVVVKPVTQVAFERHWKTGLGSLSENMHLEHIYWLGWDALRKQGVQVAEFDPWLEGVVAVDVVGDEDDPKAPSSGTSAS